MIVLHIGNKLEVIPQSETGKIDITYIKTPDNSLATNQSLLAIFSFDFIKRAEALAVAMLKAEIGSS